MLIKTLKMDFKATYRIFIAVFILMLGIVGFGAIRNDKVNLIVSLLYATIFTFVSIGSFAFLLNYYEKSMFRADAYLVRSLPIKDWEQLLSKLLIGLFWSGVSVVVAMGCAWLLNTINDYYSMEFILSGEDIPEFLFIGLAGGTLFYLTGYLAVGIAHIDWFPRWCGVIGAIAFVLLVLVQAGMEYVLTSLMPTVFVDKSIPMYAYMIVNIAVLFLANLWVLRRKTAVENN